MTDTDRLTAIERRTMALPPEGWRQQPGDAGVIEDLRGRPLIVFGTSGLSELPEGEFVVHAPQDMRWLIQQLKQAQQQIADLEADETEWRSTLDRLRGAINHAGSLMATSHVARIIGHTRVPGAGPLP
ncbi:hypothetical protein [Streptomyces hygroscopicus]|uniref:hypothetical protein n=1 Tax=Streptomyces hygroscopicus TaxID=1912 RepID=UPI000780752F|nr:hypothetical protein [Streptomyces hygroscopicus]